jgi:hypothetical protein
VGTKLLILQDQARAAHGQEEPRAERGEEPGFIFRCRRAWNARTAFRLAARIKSLYLGWMTCRGVALIHREGAGLDTPGSSTCT